MSYIDKTLVPGEKILARARFHWSYTALSWIWLITTGWFLIGIAIFFSRSLRKWTTELVVTNQRFVYKRGIFSFKTDEFTAARIQAITLSQSFWGRLLGYGHLNVRGEEIGQFGLPVIADPVGFRKALVAAADPDLLPEKSP